MATDGLIGNGAVVDVLGLICFDLLLFVLVEGASTVVCFKLFFLHVAFLFVSCPESVGVDSYNQFK